MRIVLWDLQSPINIGMILRTAEVFGAEVTAYDGHRIFEDATRLQTIRDFACGALERRPPRILAEPVPVPSARSVATAITADAQSVRAFEFSHDDCIYLGNEYDGLPDDILWGSDARVTIPMPDGYLPKPPSAHPIDPSRPDTVNSNGTPNLNVSAAAAIILFEAYSQFTQHRPVAARMAPQRATVS